MRLLFLLFFSILMISCTHEDDKQNEPAGLVPNMQTMVNISLDDMESKPSRYFESLSGLRAGLRRVIMYEGSTSNWLLAGTPGYIATQELLNPLKIDTIYHYDSLWYATGQLDLYSIQDNGVGVICRNYHTVIKYKDGTYEKGQYFAKNNGPQYKRWGDFTNETHPTNPMNKQVLKRLGSFDLKKHMYCGIDRRHYHYILNDTTRLVLAGNSTSCNSHLYSFNHTFNY